MPSLIAQVHMDPAVKTRWVEALRSGKYQQTRGALRLSETAFCASGVLCDLYDPNAWSADSDPVHGVAWTHLGYSPIFMAPEVVTWAGLQNVRRWRPPLNELEPEEGLTVSALNLVVDWNDIGKSFAELADWIEHRL